MAMKMISSKAVVGVESCDDSSSEGTAGAQSLMDLFVTPSRESFRETDGLLNCYKQQGLLQERSGKDSEMGALHTGSAIKCSSSYGTSGDDHIQNSAFSCKHNQTTIFRLPSNGDSEGDQVQSFFAPPEHGDMNETGLSHVTVGFKSVRISGPILDKCQMPLPAITQKRNKAVGAKSTTWWDGSPETNNEMKAQTNHNIVGMSISIRGFKEKCTQFLTQLRTVSLWHALVGSMLFTLYNIVFSLALASGMSSLPHRTHTMLGPIAKVAIMGAITVVPYMLFTLGSNIPAIYPTVDLFLAPFLAQAAREIDQSMNDQIEKLGASMLDSDLPRNLSDVAFVATLLAATSVGLLLTALGNYIASQVKLANIGAYLPYAVLCGFFSTVGVTLWMLAISVDTGMGVHKIITSKSFSVLGEALLHHVPGAIVGILMFFYGPRVAILVPILITTVIASTHVFMLLFGISLVEAQQQGWFWTADQLAYEPTEESLHGSNSLIWRPTAPFGVLYASFTGRVNFTALVAAFPTLVLMAFIYVLRCYLHATALRKSTKVVIELERRGGGATSLMMSRSDADAASIGFMLSDDDNEVMTNGDGISSRSFAEGREKNPFPGITAAVHQYSVGFLLSSVVGSTAAVMPSIAVGPSIHKLGPRGLSPQYGTIPFLLYFYLTDFTLVQYIPKMAFSSLLVLSSIQMLSTWFFKSYFKIKEKAEWMVAPLIIVLSFVVGPLQAVALGVGLSTFIFVSAFFRSGIVKFIANGLTVRSTVERSNGDALWLDQNGDMIQVLVLQNYLFFGNASSCINYINTMFEESPCGINEDVYIRIPPVPRYLLLDLSFVTGMDASTVDIFCEIVSLCRGNNCKVFMIGLKSSVKSVLSSAGFKAKSSDNCLRFYSTLEIALGKAEDGLLFEVLRVEERERRASARQTKERLMSGDYDAGSRLGFEYALKQIDDQHEINFRESLLPLEKFTTVVELSSGQSLFDDFGSGVSSDDRGLFFIETGIMKVERDPSFSISRGSGASLRRNVKQNLAPRLGVYGSLGHLHARSRSVANMDTLLKGMSTRNMRLGKSKFRLARIGPGFVVGVIEASTGLRNIGVHIAVTDCRLYHLSYDKMREIEDTDPGLILNLYKLLAHLSARREEIAIEQLSTLHTIMTSDPVATPLNRKTLGAIQHAINSIDA